MPALPILWRPEALADLSTILEYIAKHNPQAAANLYGDIDLLVSQLPYHPYLYRLGRIAGTRELVVHPNYVIVYSVTTVAIEIVTIMHTRQRYP
ncbi:type II toxin-antitoxin system RelE/ParE family toxin [Massilia sp. erpn]|uniref:type II toxin-antitoxin system RelE/ParE family toxin n=1 Tax=Massilia sp. erpn TaxID=2738142 RepID=UPI0021085DD6|nr:type II toxin-antitoxin system RelE/ParE family toxin [Massilia sp. erpn]UTY60491.1 type II toxin-antitoxin system RelE/ParE family toxin [Massilia sp. erpn]